MTQEICKFNKFSHCKYGKFCFYKHENKRCELSSCDARSCDFRHPKPCLFVLQNKPCKFDKLCSFDHEVEAVVNDQKESPVILNEQIIELQNLLKEKDAEIKILEEKLKENEINQKFNQNDSDLDTVSTSSEVEQLIAEALEAAVTSEESSDEEEVFNCEQCEYTTKSRRGLQVHIGKKHNVKCKDCNEVFNDAEKFRRHLDLETIVEKLSETTYEDLELSRNRSDEICLGVFSTQDLRDDGFPLLFLHCKECWDETGHVCPDLPPNASETEDDFAYNYDFYNPTRHTMIEWVVIGDMSMKGSYLDWTRVKMIINAQ